MWLKSSLRCKDTESVCILCAYGCLCWCFYMVYTNVSHNFPTRTNKCIYLKHKEQNPPPAPPCPSQLWCNTLGSPVEINTARSPEHSGFAGQRGSIYEHHDSRTFTHYCLNFRIKSLFLSNLIAPWPDNIVCDQFLHRGLYVSVLVFLLVCLQPHSRHGAGVWLKCSNDMLVTLSRSWYFMILWTGLMSRSFSCSLWPSCCRSS